MFKNFIKFAGTSLVLSTLYVGVSSAEITDILEKVYFKAGAGAMQFEKFKESKPSELYGAGFGYLKKAPKVSPLYNIGVGYRFSDAIRSDLNFQYTEVKYKADDLKQNIKTMAAFVNGYYDINFHESIVPYLTVGIGIGKNDAGNLKPSNTKGKNTTNFIWNAGLGAQYKVNENFAIDLGYRYMDLGSTKIDNNTKFIPTGKQKIRGHQAIGSLIYNF